ncbi:MAG TPA: LemA family protein [Geminicoccaceae bacterium]|nr:LemA family protein [Geminicoccaceae bacterium]
MGSPSAINRLRGFLAAGLLALGLAGCGVNEIPTLEERAKAAWGEVENQYQRRADLVPNLVETVKGYAAHEKEVLEGVVRARAAAVQAPPPGPAALEDPERFRDYERRQAELSGALGRLLAIVENYPELKANQNFLALQAQLEGTENRVAVARRDYIDAVRAYNTELRTFPGRLWAMVLYQDAEPLPVFAADPAARQAPKVSFGG